MLEKDLKKVSNICPNCGAAMVDRHYIYHCEYCGTEVDKIIETVLKVEYTYPKVKVAKARIVEDAEMFMMHKDDFEKYLKKQLCYDLANYILENGGVDILSTVDMTSNRIIFEAKTRFIDKETRL